MKINLKLLDVAVEIETVEEDLDKISGLALGLITELLQARITLEKVFIAAGEEGEPDQPGEIKPGKLELPKEPQSDLPILKGYA